MIYNAQRKRVQQWNEDSNCPDCAQPLIARRGERKLWHWAHHSRNRTTDTCAGAAETEWHLAWKLAYDGLEDWCIEQPVGKWRVDAINPLTGNVREFIHSLSPTYSEKHRSLANSVSNIWWIIDGDRFASARRETIDKGAAIVSLITPRTYAMFLDLDRRCWVHCAGVLWREWKNNVWYAREDQTMASRFENARNLIMSEPPL